MTNYYYDANGIFCGSAPANPGTVPPDNALRIPPPAEEGFVAVVNSSRDGWELVAAVTRYFLGAKGKYHAAGCSSIGKSGDWLPLADIHHLRPNATPCAKCLPPQ